MLVAAFWPADAADTAAPTAGRKLTTFKSLGARYRRTAECEPDRRLNLWICGLPPSIATARPASSDYAMACRTHEQTLHLKENLLSADLAD